MLAVPVGPGGDSGTRGAFQAGDRIRLPPAARALVLRYFERLNGEPGGAGGGGGR